MYLCVYINIIRTQPEWTFSINRNMLLGLILKRTFSIKRNLARALYRSSCRRRWQHRTWCSTLKWIKVTAGNSTLLSMVDAPPSVLPVPHFLFLFSFIHHAGVVPYCDRLFQSASHISLFRALPLCFYLARPSLFLSRSLFLVLASYLHFTLLLVRPLFSSSCFYMCEKLWCMFWCGLHSVK